MTNLTPEHEYWRARILAHRTKWIIGGIVVIGVLLFFLLRGCQNEKAANVAYDAIEDSLKKAIGEKAMAESIARGYKREIEDMDMRNAELTEHLNISRAALREKDNKIGVLAAAVKNANTNKDTPVLVNKCLELADSVEFYRAIMNETWRYQEELEKNKNERIRKSDSLAAHWQRSYENCMRTIEFTAATLPQIEPTRKLYIDGAVKVGAITGIGGGFSYLDKKGNKFSPKFSATNFGPVYEFGYGRLLGFKRKR